MLDKMRSIMSGLHDFHQLISFCIHSNTGEYEFNKEESRRAVRNKIMQASWVDFSITLR